MKTVKLISLIALMSITLSSFGNNNMGGKQTKLIKRISSYIEFPEFAKAKQMKGEVSMDISVNDKGKIEVNRMNGNPEFQQYVMIQLNKINFNPEGQFVGENLLFKVVFK